MTLPELTAYLVGYSPTLGLTAAGNLFAYGLPATASGAEPHVALVPYVGSQESETHFGEDDLWLEWPRVQVLVRGPVDDPAAAFEMAEAIYKALGKVQAQTLNGTAFFHSIRCLQPPFLLKYDENRRPVAAFNIAIEKEVSTS